MKKMRKVGVVASALATTAVCASMIVGSTFALFTDEKQVDITVTSGNVSITADVNGEVKTPETITETSENVYEVGTYATSTSAGFSASTDGLVNVTNVIPGDKIELALNVKNTGTVAAKYQFKLECVEGVALMNKLVLDVEDKEYTEAEADTHATGGVKSYTSPWLTAEAEDTATYNLTLTLPAELGNEYKNLSTSIKTTVYAVQYNAGMTNPTTYVESFEEATAENLANGGLFVLNEDIVAHAANWSKNTEIDLNGHTLTMAVNETNGFDSSAVSNGATLTLSNGKFEATGWEDCWVDINKYGIGVHPTCPIQVTSGSTLNLNNVEFVSYSGIFAAGNAAAVNINGGSMIVTNPMGQAIGTNATNDYNLSMKLKDVKIISAGTGILMNVSGNLDIDHCDITANMQCVQVRGGTANIHGGTKLTCKASLDMWNSLFETGAWSGITEAQKTNTKNLHLFFMEQLNETNDGAVNNNISATWGASNAVALGGVVVGDYKSTGYGRTATCTIANDTVINTLGNIPKIVASGRVEIKGVNYLTTLVYNGNYAVAQLGNSTNLNVVNN